ncbi:hypothetical protein HKX48_000250, partial [Thoreauomyces humboldtii]
DPGAYIEAYCKLNRFYEAMEYPLFNAVPLRRTHVQSSVHIDTTILHVNILGIGWPRPINSAAKRKWDEVLRTDKKIFKKYSGLEFGHSIYTDGVAVSISMQPPGDKKKSMGKKKSPSKAEQKRTLDAKYVSVPENIFALQIADTNANIVYIDPNKRDLLYCMDSSGQKLRYTSMQRDKETKRRVFAKERERRAQDLNDLVTPPSKTVEHRAFEAYIRFQVQHGPRLTNFYASRDNAHPTERLKAYSLKQRSEAKLINAMKAKFGAFTIVLGDWSDGGHTAKFQTSSKTSGWRKTFTAAKIPW